MALKIHHHSKRHLIKVCTLGENDGVAHIKHETLFSPRAAAFRNIQFRQYEVIGG